MTPKGDEIQNDISTTNKSTEEQVSEKGGVAGLIENRKEPTLLKKQLNA